MITWEGLAEVSDATMTHGQLVIEIHAQCERMGLASFYWPDSRKARRGWPDFSIGGPGGWVFREVKPAFGKLSSEQRLIGYLMMAAGMDWAVWQPKDLSSGLIKAQLANISVYAQVL